MSKGRPKGSKNKEKNTNNIEFDLTIGLSKMLYEKLMEFRDDNDYCIVDRVNSNLFLNLFRENIFAYNEKTVICERLYYKSELESAMVNVPKLKKEDEGTFLDFLRFSETLTDLEKTETELDENNKKMMDFKEKIESMKLVEFKEKKFYYMDAYSGTNKKLELIEFNKNSHESRFLKLSSHIIANFVVRYFFAMMFLNIEHYRIDLNTVEYDDYVDVIATLYL